MVTMTLSLLLTVLTNPVVLMKKKRSEKNLLCKLDILSVHEKILFCRHCQKNIPREAAFRGLFFDNVCKIKSYLICIVILITFL